MPFRQKLERAIAKLLSLQNDDGGIPATDAEQQSGCWTSADTLEAVLRAGTPISLNLERVQSLVDFLLDTQVRSAGTGVKAVDTGGWPLFKGKDLCTMATGHATASLILSYNFLGKTYKAQELDHAVRLGLSWLEQAQNPDDGSWGAFPTLGGDGRKPEVLATFYALLPYFIQKELNKVTQVSRVARIGAEFIRKHSNPDGSWGSFPGDSGNVCDTARAVTILIRSGLCRSADSLVTEGISFILSHQLGADDLWDIRKQTFHVPDAPSESALNQNTVCDVVVAFCYAGFLKNASIKAIQWLAKSQHESDLWYLSSPRIVDQKVSTWSTAEWIYALDLASRTLLADTLEQRFRELPKIRRLLQLLIVLVLVLVLLWTPLLSYLSSWWDSLPQKMRDLVVIGIILAFAVNIFSNFASDWIKSAWRGLQRRFIR